MCGLFGHTRFDAARIEDSRRALHTLRHRGPDSWGEWHDEDVYVGHRRLNIIDLSSKGRQPMVAAEAGIVLAVNGEIFNYKPLRRELASRHAFSSNSDSEVLLHGYAEWGIEGLLDRIDGMYAFCIYDQRRKRLLLVRDRVGIKPLHFARHRETVVWASELKAIRSYLGEDRLRVDGSALYDFLTYLYVPAPKTAYRNVYKLEPAHFAEVDVATGAVETHRYWRLRTRPKPTSASQAADALRRSIGKSVDEQMMSDVPVGFFLSGGMDSSVVVAEAVRCCAPVNTYSIGFDLPSHDETAFAQQVADRFHTNHRREIVGVKQAESLFEAMPGWYDEPFADTSALPTYFVSALARKSSTVVLTGDGGDEVFGGYRWYDRFVRRVTLRDKLPASVLRQWQRFAPALRRGSLGRIAGELDAYTLLDDVELYAKIRKRMLRGEKQRHRAYLEIPDDYDDYWYYRKYYRPELPIRTRLQYLDFHTYLPDQILTKVDRASMAVSLEARVPLLAKDLVELVFSLPESVRYPKGELKGLLRAAYADVLPVAVLRRGKKGFSIPLEHWRATLIGAGQNREEKILDHWRTTRRLGAETG